MEIFEIDLESSMSAFTIESKNQYCGKCFGSGPRGGKINHKPTCPTLQQRKDGLAVFGQVNKEFSVKTNVVR